MKVLHLKEFRWGVGRGLQKRSCLLFGYPPTYNYNIGHGSFFFLYRWIHKVAEPFIKSSPAYIIQLSTQNLCNKIESAGMLFVTQTFSTTLQSTTAPPVNTKHTHVHRVYKINNINIFQTRAY